MQNAVIIFNPRSGAHRKRNRAAEVEAMQGRLRELGVDAAPWPTTGVGAATTLARRAVDEGVDLVVGSGGDGTLNEILQGMANSRIPLGIWPSGTANVFARELGLVSDAESVAHTIARGERLRISVGRAGTRYFFLMAGIGLDASIVRSVDPSHKARFGEGAFWISGLKHLVGWKPAGFDLAIDGKTYSGAFAAVGKAARYGGGFMVTPHARLDEPLLDVCIFPTRRIAAAYLRDLLACASGDPTRFGDVVYLKTASLAATSPLADPPWVQVDGELLGPLPMTFEAVPDALTVLVSGGRSSQE